MTADATAATVALLLEEDTVTALAGANVYGSEAPDDPAFNASMPTYAVVVQPAGGIGPTDGSYTRLDGQRLEVNCYAASPFKARHLARVVHDVLKALRRRTVTYELDDESPPAETAVLLHAFMSSGGFVALREPDTRWPRVLRAYTLVYAETEIAA